MRVLSLVILLCSAAAALAGIPADCVWEVRSTGTAGNLNGGGFSVSQAGATPVDLSQSDAAAVTWTAGGGNNNLASVATSLVLTSASKNFSEDHLGNLVHITAGTNFTFGWYCIVGYTNETTVTLDRDPTNGVDNGSSGTGYLGGACSSFNCVGADAVLPLVAGNTVYVKAGTYASGAAASYAAADGTGTNPVRIIGYSAIGDRTTFGVTNGASRPQLDLTAGVFTTGDYWVLSNLRTTSTGAVTPFASGDAVMAVNCWFDYSGTTATRYAISGYGRFISCEFTSLRGAASVLTAGSSIFLGCYFHDSYRAAYSAGASSIQCRNCVVESCYQGLAGATSPYNVSENSVIRNCTTGVYVTTGTVTLLSSIIANCYQGLQVTTATGIGFIDYNDWYNNTTDIVAASGPTLNERGHELHDVDPGFISGIVWGTAGFGKNPNASFHFVDASKNFGTLGVTASATPWAGDYLVIHAGSGLTVGVYRITALATTATDNDTLVLDRTPGTNTTADHTYGIVLGGASTDFRTGSGARGLGFPTTFPGMTATRQSWVDIGIQQHDDGYTAIGAGFP